MSNVAFIGDLDLVNGFKAIGADVFGVENKEQVYLALEEIAKQDYKIVFILERWAEVTQDALERYKDRFVSTVIIPDYRGESGFSGERVKNAVIEAVGADIVKGE